MILEIIAKPFAFFSYKQVKKVEHRLGYKLELNQDGNKWIDGTMIFNMTPVWRRYEIEATGVNYYTIGSVVNGVSTRFDSNSPYYQAWLGGYLVNFPTPKGWTIEEHYQLGEADQKTWLKLYGVKNPVIKPDFKRITNLGKLSVSGYKGVLYQVYLGSNTDVGDKANRLYLTALWAGGVYFFKKSNPHLQLNYSNFIPKWNREQRLNPYQIITLEGYVAIFEIDDKTKAILYANGCSFTDKLGKKTDTFKQLQTEFKDSLKEFRIEKVS